MLRALTLAPLTAVALLGCNATEPISTFSQLEQAETDAPIGFQPSASLEGGEERLLVTGSVLGSLCDSRLTLATMRSGTSIKVALTRNFLPPQTPCGTDPKKIDYVVKVYALEPATYAVTLQFDDTISDLHTTETLGTAVVISCPASGCSQ